MKWSFFIGKRVLITGASSGIGAELALQIARGGGRVALAARRADRLEEHAAACRTAGGEAFVVTADVSREDECKRMVAESVAHLGGLDLVFVNAGISMWELFEKVTDLSIFRTIMETNYYSAVYTSAFALPHLKASRGRFVAISSLTGKTGVPTRTAYAASKHAMNGFFDSLRAELWRSGVGVTIICPGFVATDVRKHALTGDGSTLKHNPLDEDDGMTVQECVRRILRAVEKGKRELVMTPFPTLTLMLRLIYPELLDRIARKRTQLT